MDEIEMYSKRKRNFKNHVSPLKADSGLSNIAQRTI